MRSDKKGFANFDEATAAAHTWIAAPGAGKHIAVDHFNLMADGGANTVTIKFGDTVVAAYDLPANGAVAIDAPEHNPLQSGVNEAFTVTLSAATSVVGFALYRIVGE